MLYTKFVNFVNERYEINNLSEHVVILNIEDVNDDYFTFLLYDIIEKTPIGYIAFGYYNVIESYMVDGAYSKHGYGPFLYESAMTKVYPNGISMSRLSTTLDDALNVWNKFLNREDVRHERMYSDEITHKKEDWGIEFDGTGFLDDQPKYKQSIFDLEDTRFFYNYGKDKLENLLEIGRKYQIDNDISDDDIEYMKYELEAL